MTLKFILSLKEEIELIEDSDMGRILLSLDAQYCTFKQTQKGLKLALQVLLSGGATLEYLTHTIQKHEGGFAVLNFYTTLQEFFRYGWLYHSVLAAEKPIAIAIPIASDALPPCSEINSESRYQLSRFAYYHQVNGAQVLESPLSKLQLLIKEEGAVMLTYLSQPIFYNELSSKVPAIDPLVAKQFMSLLFSVNMLTEACEDGTNLEDTNSILTQWEFHDLLFHTRSRAGRHRNPMGATNRFRGKIDPPSALKPRMSSQIYKLYQPDLEALKLSDPSLSQVLETRQSIREFGPRPITVEQLGEFFFRCNRVKQMLRTKHGESAKRPYPSGGASYELELYPVINDCQGIAPGLYQYQPLTHELCQVSERCTEEVNLLLYSAQKTMKIKNTPQILIIITARFQRVSWRYESMAYALVLKHVGVLYQTMYLVSTAMKLASCSLGGGNADLFSRATGCNYYVESSVGEFVLGSYPSG